MPVVFCGICPHPPIMVPEVGKKRAEEVASSQQAMHKLGQRLIESHADTVVMISPHSVVFRDAIGINFCPRLQGNLGEFGASNVSFDLENDPSLAREIKRQAEILGVAVVELEERTASRLHMDLRLDHGLMVPLYFLRKSGANLPLVPVSMGLLPFELLYSFGAGIAKAADALKKKVAVLASGDLSHRLTYDAPAGYDSMGKEFDRLMVQLVAQGDIEGIFNLDKELVERAGECGLRPIIMMFGALDGVCIHPEVLSYEGPFGVGYMVAALIPGPPDPSREILKKFLDKKRMDLASRRAKESFLVKVARQTVENYYGRKVRLYEEQDIPEEFQRAAGAFVSLKKHGNLRGCIGTIFPQCKNIIEEVRHNAIHAATRDPRFYPVEEEELDDLVYSVDVLSEPEPVQGLRELDPKKYGVIVRSGNRSGVLLPDLEGINTAEEQVAIARQKAGIGSNEPVQLERFTVQRYT